jgi:hypothetical protein
MASPQKALTYERKRRTLVKGDMNIALQNLRGWYR